MTEYPSDTDTSETVRVLMTSGLMEGKELSFWQACSIGRGLDNCASSASVAVGRGKLREAGYDKFPIHLGDGVQVLIGEDPVLIGWVDKPSRTRTADEHGVNIQIRSVTADLVDCSAMNSPGQWVKAKLARIAKDMVTALYKIPVVVPPKYDVVVPNFEIEQGEAVFDAVERLAHSVGLIVHDTAAGVLMITRPGDTRAEGALVHLEGPKGGPDPRNNVLESDYQEDGSKLFSDYIVKGQSEGGKAKAGASGSARDAGVTRYRPKIISPPGEATAADCTRLAQWEAARRRGQAARLVHGARGWRQTKGGKLWDIDQIVPVQDDLAEMYRDLLITDVRYTMDDKGRKAVLTLEPPEAWTPQPVVDKHGSGEGGKWAAVKKAVGTK